MEVPYVREEEEGVVGMDLKRTKKKKKSFVVEQHVSQPTKKPLSPTNSDGSCVSTELSGDSNLEFLAKMGSNNNINFAKIISENSEVHKVAEVGVGTPVVVEEEPAQKFETLPEIQEKNANFEEINVAEFEGTNGFSVHQNGSNVVHSIRESNGGDKEMDAGSSSSSFSKSPDTAVGLKYVESLLDESSSGVIPTDTVNAENGLGDQNNNTSAARSKEPEPEVEEYDVERVIQKQDTHDLYCPNCRSCITKRVILRRRKRKVPEISTDEEVSGSRPDQSGSLAAPEDIPEESQKPPPVDGAPDSRLDAISCFSCFSIFVPSGEGFLCWRFKPKPGVAQQPDGTSIDAGQAEDSKAESTGTIFPLWVVTCCQPAERKKPDETAASIGSSSQPILEDEASTHQTEPPLPPSDEVPVSSTPETMASEHTTGQPQTKGPQHVAGTKPLYPIKPYGDTPSSETPSSVATDEGRNFPLWILTCCQPSTVGEKTGLPAKLDSTAQPQENPSAPSRGTDPGHLVKPGGIVPPRETPSAPSGVTESENLAKPDGTVPQGETQSAPSGGTRPSLAPSDEDPVPSSKPELPAIYDPDSGTSFPYKPISPIGVNDDMPLSPYAESPGAQGSGASLSSVSPMPPKPEPPVIPSGSHEAQPLLDVEVGLARESPRPGVSGVDIIKAIVYGGLLESITSLSVITSAAGGDATTLNIVALGLANVFGGLVVLVHSLRLLNHEHTNTDHYEAQLGRPGHYMLHAIVAIISYLVFGLMSPVIYGFTFRKSDNKDYKLAVLAAAALACITVLSAAKAYVRNPPKSYIKTIFYYISLGFMVSGLGYVAGDLINMLLIKLGVFDSSAPDNVPVLATGVVNGAWSSY